MAISNPLEMKEIQLLIRKISEYITAMRIEIQRKQLVASSGPQDIRAIELSCYMTLCGMEPAHKFLAFKNAMNTNYKIQNNITAAHFARLVVDLEPSGVILNIY